uniref:Uncharacterized protein n=1 Tax=Ixodes ricinus TaxID=34613 RepID=A0A0K8RDL2_IXORI
MTNARVFKEVTLTTLRKERAGRTTKTYIVTMLASTSNIGSPVRSTWNIEWLRQKQKKERKRVQCTTRHRLLFKGEETRRKTKGHKLCPRSSLRNL